MTSSVSVTLINMYFHHPSLNLASFAYFNIPFGTVCLCSTILPVILVLQTSLKVFKM